MKILLLNPNMTQAMTDNMATLARKAVGDRAEIIPVTATRGFPYIASRAEAQLAGGLVLEMIAEHVDEVDAVVIAAFGDPGLSGARDLFDLPIVGMAEAAVMSASLLGDTFAIVTFSPLMTRWYTDCVALTGMNARFRGVYTPHTNAIDVANVSTQLRDLLIELSTKAATQDGADVIIMGGAPLAGLASDVANDIPAIVVDPITSAVLQALLLAEMTDGLGYENRANKPAPKAAVGLSAPLTAAFRQGQAL